MNREIQTAVIGLLTVASSPHTDSSGDDMHALVSGLLRAEVPIPAVATPQAVAQAVADGFRDPVEDLIGCFCAAFSSLAKINDAGETEMSAQEMLRQLALQWQAEDDA